MDGNKKYLWAVIACLTIPVIFLAGGALFAAIDPERLAGRAHYVRNFQLLTMARNGVMLAMFGAVVVAWLATCLLVVKAKNRPAGWLLLGFLGPLGLAILASLRDLEADPSDLYERFTRRLGIPLRIVYEIGYCWLGWMLAWQLMVMKREASIFMQSISTGLSRNQILDQQNAQSGMWAFGELNEVVFFFALIYLLRPFCVNAVGALFGHRASSEAA